jgi:hypothetical protein
MLATLIGSAAWPGELSIALEDIAPAIAADVFKNCRRSRLMITPSFFDERGRRGRARYRFIAAKTHVSWRISQHAQFIAVQ